MAASRLALVWLAAACLLGLAACDGSPRDDRPREPVSLEGMEVYLVQDAVLSLSVPSCNGNPEATVTEMPTRVLVSVAAAVGGQDDCLDSITVELGAPLDDRELVDEVSGTPLVVFDDR